MWSELEGRAQKAQHMVPWGCPTEREGHLTGYSDRGPCGPLGSLDTHENSGPWSDLMGFVLLKKISVTALRRIDWKGKTVIRDSH